MNKKKASIKDVAKEVGVSAQTISNYLNQSALVSKKTKEKIEATIRKLNYIPNVFARSLRIGKSNTIGVIIPEIANPFYSAIIEGIEEIASKNKYITILASSGYDESKLEDELNKFTNYVDGVILCTNILSDTKIRKLLKKGIPIVGLDVKIENGIIPSVEVDNYNAIYQGIEYLIKMGHKNIYFISESLNLKIIYDRFNAYKDCLRDNDIKVDDSKIFIDDRLKINKIKVGYEIMKEIIGSIKPPISIFGTSDLIVIGAMKVALENHFKIPHDISFLGNDNIVFSGYTNPPLSTIKQPKKDMGRVAMELLVDIIAGKRIKTKRIMLATELIDRLTIKNLNKLY